MASGEEGESESVSRSSEMPESMVAPPKTLSDDEEQGSDSGEPGDEHKTASRARSPVQQATGKRTRDDTEAARPAKVQTPPALPSECFQPICLQDCIEYLLHWGNNEQRHSQDHLSRKMDLLQAELHQHEQRTTKQFEDLTHLIAESFSNLTNVINSKSGPSTSAPPNSKMIRACKEENLALREENAKLKNDLQRTRAAFKSLLGD